ncbi:thiol-disulfide oxidoreductase DCC family protein [Bacillus manliponensis]|uniref:thiol-disulfide oxidoreductase DCC family protein n=1 Tax=Bacillus manliponensis TaxID=574376 RepID=UPI003512A736
MIVFYDSWCPMCTAVAERTKGLDKKGEVKFLSFRDQKVIEEYELSEEKQKKMEQHLYIYKDGRSYKGIESVYVLAKAIPSYWAMVPFIKLSIVLGFGHKLYDYIAKNRKIVPTGHCKDGVCEVPQKK